MKHLLIAAGLLLTPALACAETSHVDTTSLPSKTVYGAAQLTPLAVNVAGKPAVVLLRLDAGTEVPPHTAKSGLRLITVVKGEMSWGDGETVDRTAEKIYQQGSFLMLPAGQPHWLAARKGEVLLQLVVLDDEKPTPAVEMQMQ